MEKEQINVTQHTHKDKKPTYLLSSKIIPITIILMLIHFLLNFLASPLLKSFYLIELVFFFICAISYPLDKIIIPVFALYYIEGQGRILWEYHPFFRVIFDIILFITLLKSISLNHLIIPKGKLPKFITFAIFGHFFWYIIQIFNISSVGLVGVIGASKIYIFPILIFFLFLSNPISHDKKNLIKLQYFTFFILFMESLLIIFEMGVKEFHLLKISPYYRYAMKNNIFIAESFRPFGTSYLPGGFSGYIALTIGLLFISPIKNIFYKLSTFALIGLTWFALFLMQVRSTFAKQMAIILLIQFFLFISHKFKFKVFIQYLMVIFMLSFYLLTIPNIAHLFPRLDLEKSLDRVAIFSNFEKAKASRIGVRKLYDTISTKLTENPLGLGPGRTGAATSLSLDIITKDPLWDERSSWSLDNLFISLSIDLGFGMFFYSIIIISLPLLLLYISFTFYRKKLFHEYRVSLISGIVTSIIVIGNWGAVGLPYNPESFMYWFWIALGLNTKQVTDHTSENFSRKNLEYYQ